MKTMMKKNLMKACAVVAVAAIPVAFASFNTVEASADTSIPTATEFYMTEGAAVRTDANELGIRFSATITQGYWEDLQETYGADATYSFYSVVTDGKTPITKDYGTLTPDFTSKTEYTFYSTIVYTTAQLESAGLLDEACELALSAQTYVDVTKAGETEPVTIAAYGQTGKRSMKAVANAAVLAGEDDTDLLKYFTVGNRSNLVEGYVFADNSGVVTMEALPDLTEVTDMEVYYGAQKLAATYANGKISFDSLTLAEEQNQAYISVFTGGKVYSTKVAKATKITQSNVTDLLTISGEQNVYLAEDVDLTGITWSSTASFSGIFDGGNHAIKNLTTNDNNAFFKNAQGTIKNVAFVNAKLKGTKSAAIVFDQTGHLDFSNVFIQIASKGTYAGAVMFGSATTSTAYSANVTDTVVFFNGGAGDYKLVGYTLSGHSLFTNVHLIGGAGKLVHSNPGYIMSASTTSHYTDLAAFNTAEKTLTDFLTSCVATYLNA